MITEIEKRKIYLGRFWGLFFHDGFYNKSNRKFPDSTFTLLIRSSIYNLPLTSSSSLFFILQKNHHIHSPKLINRTLHLSARSLWIFIINTSILHLCLDSLHNLRISIFTASLNKFATYNIMTSTEHNLRSSIFNNQQQIYIIKTRLQQQHYWICNLQY